MDDRADLNNRILIKLREQVLNLIDDLLSICPDESDILLVRIYFETSVDSEQLMKGFVKWVYPWKAQIAARDQSYFDKNDHMFGPLPTDRVANFRRKMKDGTFTDEDKQVIWEYFDVFISLIEQYNKIK